ncbi:serine protease snake-like [Camponotus floridanus]|uniref:serine protease snake-like n=1 Tax=Camponotus floridanus TaxID=104421 RepID=UPI000DC6749B|nr:serine protease snake-like [Camponotus floridanus]
MSQSILAVSPLLLLILVSILFPTYGKNIGEGCNVDNTSEQGICKHVRNCSIVYQQLLADKLPESICGYSGIDPIVCCPISQTIEITHTEVMRPLKVDSSRGSLARAKCAEAAEAVYGLVFRPALDSRPVNGSRCALNARKLIVGGIKADPREFPHMAAIGFTDPKSRAISWSCGGSLISAKIVLTVAQCAWNNYWGNATWVRVGDLNLVQTNDDAMPQDIRIAERIKHPEYKTRTVYNDIAILRLEKEATYNAWVRPACLPVDLPDIGTDNKAVASGWGLVDWLGDTRSDNLLKVTLKLVDHATCNASFWEDSSNTKLPLGIVDKWQICAGEVGRDTCQGDSGGPLVIFNKDHDCMYNIIGITSFGRSCGSNIPGVYTRVYYYIPWIERVAWPEYFSDDESKITFLT